ncbi:MAG: peptidylprolyl isomerase [Gammaproteobacteria bacterium]
MSKTLVKLLPAVALAGLLAGCGAGHHGAGHHNANNGAMNKTGSTATAAPASGTVLVTVNGEPITASEVDAYVLLRTHGKKIQLNPEQRYQIAEQLVQLNLAYQAARQENLTQNPNVRAGLALQKKLFLANEFVEHYMDTAKVPDSTLKSEYAKMATAQSGEEYKARHILVKNKSKAEDIIKQLNKGAKFATLAKKYSTDTGTAKQGGELGWFKPKQMVPKFSAAVEKLKPGEYTKTPVHTKFGWHVILLEKERKAAPPSYTASKPMLAQHARSTMLRDRLGTLKSQASVDWKIPNPASVAAAARAKAAAAASANAAHAAPVPKPTTAPKPATD